jgi:hypothetical protein
MRGQVPCLVLGFILLFQGEARAQAPPLAEVARKEQERRKAIPPATRVLTNKDLPRITAPAASGTTSDKDVPAPSPGIPETVKPEGEKLEKDEAWWRARIGQARDTLRRDEVLLDALQARVDNLTFVGREDPYRHLQVGEDLRKALVELERVRMEVGDLKKEIEEIEEEARKASVPPGWLR